MMDKILICIIRIYQNTISRLIPNRCRFYPSCSEYTIMAIQEFNTIEGIKMGIKRVLKCHPFNPGGIDLIRRTK
jgi:uncharacterized protein